MSKRPGSLTVVIVLTFIAGALDILAGVAGIVYQDNSALLDAIDKSPSDLVTAGLLSIAAGLLTLLVGWLLAKGSRAGRAAVTALMVIRIGFYIWSWIQLGSAGAATAVVGILFAAVILTILWNQDSNRYFAES
jgi:hypothetical protein